MFTLLRDAWYIFKISKGQFFNSYFLVGWRCWFRYWWYALVLRRTKTIATDGTDNVATTTVSHNLKGLRFDQIRGFSGHRPDKLLKVASVIDHVDNKKPKHKGEAKLLCIGPRAESELFLARGHGFKKKNIHGLDLISYSPLVKIGDMHAMPYDDNSFDVIIVGWVLAYSDNPEQAMKEIVRISKPHAVVVIGYQYHPLSPDEVKNKMGYVVGSSNKMTHTDELEKLFEGHIESVFMKHDPLEHRRDKPGDMIFGFAVKK
jgi:hypothetical protein